MTGMAALRGALGPYSWSWDIRAVNGRGLDLRLRVPDWIDGLEPALRKAVSAEVARGNVTLNLRLTRQDEEGAAALDGAALARAVALVREAEMAAREGGLELAPTTAADLLSQRGVLVQQAQEDDHSALRAALIAQVPELMDLFNQMRRAEGAALAEVLLGQVAEVEALVAQAEALLDARTADQRTALKAQLARVLEAAEGVDPARLEQELALIAVKSDLREELDRLTAHVAQARALIGGDAPRGRKLDFLVQEFNREANTLCSKAGHTEMTRIGLDLKAVIDQMREQVQNVE
ncbi:MAG: YicC family protein [Rhodobacterales bacterium]|nr:MAG: YicC family protein [Rhodobacterales bacterium]